MIDKKQKYLFGLLKFNKLRLLFVFCYEENEK